MPLASELANVQGEPATKSAAAFLVTPFQPGSKRGEWCWSHTRSRPCCRGRRAGNDTWRVKDGRSPIAALPYHDPCGNGSRSGSVRIADDPTARLFGASPLCHCTLENEITFMRNRKLLARFAIVLSLILVGVGLAGFVLYKTRGIAIPSGTRQARSSVSILLKDQDVHIITDNKRFTVLDFSPSNQFPDPKVQHLLLLESFWSDRRDGVEGQLGRVTVEASQITLAGPGGNLWTLQEDGDEGKLDGERFYKVIKYGCCDAPNVYSYFFLGNGQKIYTSVTPLYGIVVPNAGNELTRYIAYGYRDEEASAILQYGSDSRVMRQVEITAKGDVGIPKIRVEYQGKPFEDAPLMLWGVDGRRSTTALSDFFICVRFYSGAELRFPVKNDDIQLNSATIPANFSVALR